MSWLTAALTTSVVVTVGLAGLAITIGLLSMIKLGQAHFHSLRRRARLTRERGIGL